ncbi:DUF4859 domain-containing protein [Carboxylicivirga caseinilyticus]|uniref:DUF4859 domain-containing protein n=1 Tax=Carboxylicivirga caseinilyticus TaxID=3417572 RepID=UPI003D357B8C|nr:DUF4859 domain-containing protein [Marinilabiliaceae bacterium A049]
MKLLNVILNKQKPVNAGFCIIHLVIILLLFTSCGKNNSIVAQTPNNGSESDDPKSDVVVLTEDDVTDYQKYYKPAEMADMDVLRSDSKWSFVRSRQSDHFIVFWEEGFGDDPNSSDLEEKMRIDIDDLLQKAEEFFSININTLKFADLGTSKTNLETYKMQIYLHYTEEWMAFGAGYDDVIGALWVNPATCKPVGSTIAHEIGHSFQYQVYADLLAHGEITNDFTRGFRYGFGGNGGNAFWEQTAQWQAFQSYPMEAFTSYNFSVYCNNYHRHICHEHQRYASYWMHYFWTDKHGIDAVARVWRESVSPEDPLETYMRIYELSVSDLNDEIYEAATKFVTWDLDAIRSNGENYIGQLKYKFYQLEDGSYQVAYSHCPGSTGYNVIPLNVPDAGTTVTTKFTALSPGSDLAPNDPGNYADNETTLVTTHYNTGSQARAGWRYGYVALLTDGTRVYGDMNQNTSAEIDFIIPANCERLWLVVTGAPKTYIAHPWDEIESNDDQWPYIIKFTNTDLLGNVTVDTDKDPENLTLTYNLEFKADKENYTGTIVNLFTNGDIAKVAQALSIQPSDIGSKMLEAKSSPSEGKIAFAAVEPDESLNYETTANGYGFWFDSNGSVIGWGESNDSKLYCELNAGGMQFSIGQFPGKSSAGDSYQIKEALVYTKGGSQYVVTFIFNVGLQ